MMKLQLLVYMTWFSMASAGYDEQRAVQYASLAGASYCQDNQIRDWSCGDKCIPGVENVRLCKGVATRAVIGTLQGRCFVAFEGTRTLESMISDLKFTKTADAMTAFLSDQMDGDCKVHSGFVDVWESLRPCVEQQLASIDCGKDKPLHLTGHSLGGATATLAAMELTHDSWNIAEIYTFGSPRVGTPTCARAFTRKFRGRSFRVTHGRDPIADLPPEQLPYGKKLYEHVEPEVFYKGTIDDGYEICNHIEEDCAEQYFPEFYKITMRTVRYHMTYMGVATTKFFCSEHPTGTCSGGPTQVAPLMKPAWCSIPYTKPGPCDTNLYGKGVYCANGFPGFRKCYCNPGYCPWNGMCVPEHELHSAASLTMPAQGASLFTNLPGVSVYLMLFLVVASLVFVARVRMWRKSTPPLQQQLLVA